MEGNKKYMFVDFKSFGITKEGAVYCIVLIPKKRFGARVVVFFPPDKGEKIVDAFGMKLPMAEVKDDLIDRIVRWLKI